VKGALLKRSVNLHGHATSLALEPEFWAVLDAAAKAGGFSLSGLIASIDDHRLPIERLRLPRHTGG